MIPYEVKEQIWKKVLEEFPEDEMMRDLHFIRELIPIAREEYNYKGYTGIGEIVRQEITDYRNQVNNCLHHSVASK